MQNARARALVANAVAGNRGAIYAAHPTNILIGRPPHLHVVAPKDYDKKHPPNGGFYFQNLWWM